MTCFLLAMGMTAVLHEIVSDGRVCELRIGEGFVECFGDSMMKIGREEDED
jgi:hypothetical protein